MYVIAENLNGDVRGYSIILDKKIEEFNKLFEQKSKDIFNADYCISYIVETEKDFESIYCKDLKFKMDTVLVITKNKQEFFRLMNHYGFLLKEEPKNEEEFRLKLNRFVDELFKATVTDIREFKLSNKPDTILFRNVEVSKQLVLNGEYKILQKDIDLDCMRLLEGITKVYDKLKDREFLKLIDR